jgi:hypothetical protein
MGNVLASVAKSALKFAIAFFLMAALLMGFSRYKSSSVEAFCDATGPDETPESVMARAAELGYPAFNAMESRGEVTVLNQSAPYFRYACELQFKAGRVVAKQVRAGD